MRREGLSQGDNSVNMTKWYYNDKNKEGKTRVAYGMKGRDNLEDLDIE